MKRAVLAGSIFFGLVAIEGAEAAPFLQAALSPIIAPDVVIDFGNNSFPNSTVVTTQFPGVTFGAGYVYANTINTDPSVTHGVLVNAGSTFLGGGGTTQNPGSVFFNDDVTDAVFSYRGVTSTTTFSAYLDNVLQEFFSAPVDFGVGTSGRFYGFVNLLFDEIRISMDSNSKEFSFDNLQFNNAAVSAVPLPATLPLFAAGLGAMGYLGRCRNRVRVAAVR